MEIIELRSQKTKESISEFLEISSQCHSTKQSFFYDWATATCQSDALLYARYNDILINRYELLELKAFDKMNAAIDNEISEYAFKSIHWRY